METVISWALFSHTIYPRFLLFKQRWLPWRQCEYILHNNTIQNGCYFFLLKSQYGASYLMGIVFAYYMSKMAIFFLLFKQRWLPWRQCEQLLHSNTIQNGCYFFLLKSQDGASYLMGIVFAYYISKMAVFSLLFKQRWLPWRHCEQLLHSNTIVNGCYFLFVKKSIWRLLSHGHCFHNVALISLLSKQR